MLLLAESGLCAVWVVRECQLKEFVRHLPAVASKTHIILLVYGLKLGVEATNYSICKSLRLNLRPVLNLIRRDILHVVCFVKRRPGVCAVSSDCLHQLVVLVRYSILRSLLRYAVNLCVDGLALRLIGGCAIDLEQTLNLVEQWLLRLVVLCSKLVGTFEHQMLEVVRQTCSLGWVVLRTYTHRNHSLQAWLLLVHRHINLQSVVEGVDACCSLIALDRLVTVATRYCKHRYRQNHQPIKSLHIKKHFLSHQ